VYAQGTLGAFGDGEGVVPDSVDAVVQGALFEFGTYFGSVAGGRAW